MSTAAAGAADLAEPAQVGGASAPRGWVRSPAWDLFWLHAPAWMFPLALLLSHGWPSPDDSPLSTLYLVLAGLFWIGHRFSSTWMAWMSSAYRPLLRSQPHRFITVPVLVMVATVMIVADPLGALPGSATSRALVLGGVDYLLVSHHFAAQHFGLLSLYRGRAGRSGDAADRRWDRAFALGIGGLAVILAELLQGATTVPDRWLAALGLTDPLLRWAEPLTLLGQGTVVVATVLLLLRERRTGPWGPRALYIVELGGMALAAFTLDLSLFIMLWTAQHWLAAMGLASVVVSGEPEPPQDARWHGIFHHVNSQPQRWVLVVALLSLVTMPLYEVESSGGPDDQPALAALGEAASSWLLSEPVLPWLLALGFATAFLHYLLDRAVWRLSHPEVRRAAKPLLRPPPG